PPTIPARAPYLLVLGQNNPSIKGAINDDAAPLIENVNITCKDSGGFNANNIVKIPTRTVTVIDIPFIRLLEAPRFKNALYTFTTILPLAKMNNAAIVDCPALAIPANTIPAKESGNIPCAKVGMAESAISKSGENILAAAPPNTLTKIVQNPTKVIPRTMARFIVFVESYPRAD